VRASRARAEKKEPGRNVTAILKVKTDGAAPRSRTELHSLLSSTQSSPVLSLKAALCFSHGTFVAFWFREVLGRIFYLETHGLCFNRPHQAPKKGSKKKETKPVKAAAADPLFPARPRTFQVGGDIRPAGRDLSRFVKWPVYVRIQRQRAVLYQRLKVPPAINQFTKTLSKNEAMTVFTLLNKYRPETPAAKKQRLKEAAAAAAGGKDSGDKVPHQIKFGLKHVTTLIEEKKAELVLIACDVDPLELVMWMPALCRKMEVPFMIVKDKARLGALVHQKTAAAVCLTGVDKADAGQLQILQNLATEKYNDNAELLRKWGGGIMGLKTQAKLDKRAKAMAVDEAKKLASLGKA
jgi:large subunit ribosomal protein L7Ae